jgi:tetratricopeptide (TPR) repeat protein
MSEHAATTPHPDLKQLEARGWALLEQKKYDAAIKAFDRVFKQQADNIAAFQGKIAALRKKRDFAAAGALLDKALAAHPEHPGILSERAWLFVEQKKYEDAIAAFDGVLKLHPRDENMLLWKIALLRNLRRFDDAAQSISNAEKLFPHSLRLCNERAWLHFHQLQQDQAIAIFDRVLEQHPHDDSALQGKIASLRTMARYAEATELVDAALADAALRDRGDSPGLYSERGWVHFEQACYAEAESDFRLALTLTPDDPHAHVNLAWALLRQQTDAKLDAAAHHCRAALAQDGHLAEAYGCLGNVAFKRGRVREAEACFLRSIECDPARGSYADLGALYNQMGRYDEAKAKLDLALQHNPDDVYARIELGELYLQTGKIDAAVRELRWAAAIDPDHPGPCKALAIGLMEAGKLTEAEKLLRNAIRRLDQSRRWELHLMLCRLLTRIGDDTNDAQWYEEALKEVKTAIRLQPRHAAPYFYGGIVRFKLADYRAALGNFRRCLQQGEDGERGERGEEGEHRLDAELNIRRVQALMARENKGRRVGFLTSFFLAGVFLIQLIALWVLRLNTAVVTDTMLTVLLPILLGLMVVAVVLPWLSRLKLTGLEAELSEPAPAQPSGPKGAIGEIGFGSVLPKSI